MTEKSYATNVWTILLVSTLLMLFFFALVIHHRDVEDRVEQHRATMPGPASGAAERTKSGGHDVGHPAETPRESATKK